MSVQRLAVHLLETHGGLVPLAHTGIGLLSLHPGIGYAKGLRLLAAIEIGRRALIQSTRLDLYTMKESRAVDAWARPQLVALEQEELWLLALDGGNRLRAARRIALGGGDRMQVAARDLLRVALREGALSFVLVHNHPSGNPTPSEADRLFTLQIANAAETIGVPLLDHVIVASQGYVSMLDAGLLPLAQKITPP